MTDLLTRLRPVARRAAYQRPQLQHLAGRHERCECVDLADFYHTADAAAFFAYCELGGDPEDPAAFAWQLQADQLLSRTRIWLAREMQGKQTVYGDFRSRRGGTTGRRAVPEDRAWDAWVDPRRCRSEECGARWIPRYTPSGNPVFSMDDGGRGSNARTHWAVIRTPVSAQFECYQPEQDLADRELAQVFPALAHVLTPYECWIVEQHHARGRTLRDIAADVAAGLAPAWRTKLARDYSGPAGLRRAEKHVQKVYERALARAAAELDPQWRTAWEDCAA